jgi:GTP-binding protein EngB required for normal cell division
LREKEQLINKFEKPMGRPTSPNISNKERTPSQEQSISVNEQQKGSKSPSPSMPQVTLKPHEQSKEIEELPSSSPLLNLENMYSQKEQHNSVDEPPNLSTIPSPQPFPRKTIQSTDAEHLCNSPRSAKISTTENIAPSNEETKHVKEQCKMPKSSRVSPPPVSPRMKHQNSNLNGPIMPTTPLKSSTAKQTFLSEKKPDNLNEHDNILGSSAKSTSDATRPLKEQLDDGEKQSKSANLSVSSNKKSSKIEKTMKRSSSSSNLSDTKRISSYEKQPLKKDEHPKSPTSLTRSSSDICLTVKQKSEDNKELFNSSISSKRSDVENTSSRTKQLVSVEDSTNRSRSSTPSIPRSSSRQRRTISRTNSILNSTGSSNSSTVESTALSKEKSHSGKEPSDMSHPPIILTPKAALRTKQKYINDQEPLNNRTSLKLSSVNRTSSSENQLDHPAEHNSMSGSSSKLALDASQPRKEQSEGREKQLELSSLPTSSNVESIQSLNKLVEEIREPFSSSTQSNLLNAEETSPQDKQCAHLNEQSKSPTSLIRSSSDISLIVKQENKDNNESPNSLISPKRLDIKNTSPRTLQFASLEDLTHQSRSLTPQPSPRERRRSANTKNQFDITESLNSSTAKSAALSNGQSNLSHSPKILTPQATSRAKQDSINNNEPLNRQTSLKLSTIEQTTKSEEISKSTVEQVSSPKSSPIPSPETSQQTEKQSEDTEEQSAQLKPPQLLSTEHALSSEQYLNQAKKQSDIQSSQMLSTSEVTTREGHRPNSSRLSAGKYINILLLGESGVGKSTFINALVNYHAFETFEQARSNKPLVVMPVSFLMTVGDNFEEKIVKFGDVDSNENHNHLGQSVTQHCRSYVFPISAQTKLRIIDTPGMGDTRGLEQDDLNMQHILSFINNLSHLNAICILLKPNESRLNIVLRSYFTRLLNFLGENARNNIVFCFTNTRATFFAPGNTGPLLKNMIKNVPIKDIPFEKTNTFCFDSESFRYLVALQNGIEFDSYQQTEYQQSWKSSVTESNRLLQYICGELRSYSQNEWQSIEHAQFKINQIIRPMLETTRNIVRNTTLLKKSLSNLLIKLCPTALSEPAAICYTCPRTPERFSKFWILSDDLHTFSDKCNNCDCSRRKHIEVNYKLEYELTQYDGEQSFDMMMTDFNQLRRAILEVGQFYAYVVNTLKQNDPMLSALEQIIAEESQICSEKGSKCLNSTLHNLFVGLIEEYKERRTISASIDLPVDLPSVYELIKDISEIGEIKEQIYAIKQTQKKYMKRHEKQVS